MDLRAIGSTVDIVEHINMPSGIVLNASPPARGDVEAPTVRRARQALKRYNLPLAPFAITERPTLQHPAGDGRAYIELYPEGRPAREIGRLHAWVRKYLGQAGSAAERPRQAAAGSKRG